nr:MAG TPA: hypothetical protein [Caudoviricetes sp.]
MPFFCFLFWFCKFLILRADICFRPFLLNG